jgi:hypothetical protein
MIYHSDGSRADVQAKIDLSSSGDTVTIPAGSFTWTTPVTISGKAITLEGAGADRVLARSDTSVSVGTGSKVFTLATEEVSSIEELKSQIISGATLRIYRGGGEIDPITSPPFGITGNLPWMEGTVTSLVGSTLTMNITSTNYTGTFFPWVVTRKPTTSVIANTVTAVGALTITESTAGNVRVSGIHFGQQTGADNYAYLMYVGPTTDGQPVLVHDCSFTPGNFVATQCLRWASNRGVIWNCSFNFLPASFGSQNGIYHEPSSFTASWTTPSTMGTDDTTGTNNFYVESCDFHFCNDVLDSSDNGRVSIRQNLFNNCGIGIHGPDTGTWGARHYEVYNNQFVFTDAHINSYFLNGFLIPRGGTGVFTENVVDDISSFAWGEKTEVLLQMQMLTRNAGPNPGWGANNDLPISSATAANPTVITTDGNHGMTTGKYTRISGSNTTPTIDGYHQITRLSDTTFTVPVHVTVSGNTGKSNPVDYSCPRQMGYGYVTGAGVDGLGRSDDIIGYVGDVEPFYKWDNTGDAGDTPLGLDGTNNGDFPDPDVIGDYLIAGRDYFDDGTAKPGWVPYPFPQPLRDNSGSITIDGTLTVAALTLPAA